MSQLLHTRRVFVIIFGLGLFVMLCRNVTDPDVWWHLRTGELILQSHHIVRADPYSFTRAAAPWIDHEWLSQLVMFGIYRIAGFGGLMIVFGLLAGGALLLVFLRLPHPSVAALATLLGAFAAAPSCGVRPQMFTFLLASVFLFILQESEKSPKLLWWIPPLTLLWANLHAGYALGIAFILLFAAGELLEAAVGTSSWDLVLPRVRWMTAIAVISCAVVVINPYGIRLYSYPFETLHSASMQNYISEWLSPNFHDPSYLPLLLMILGTLVLPAISSYRPRLRDLLLLLVMTYAALRSVRHVPIYVLVAVPVLSNALAAVITDKYALFPMGTPIPLTRKKMGINAAFLVIFAAFVVARLGYLVGNQTRAERKEYPAAAVAFLQSHPLPGPILNHYNWGGYLIWKLYPQYRVFIDGRADIYGDQFMDQLADLYYVKGTDWSEPLEVRGIRTVLLPPDAPLVGALLSIPRWTEIYRDSQAVIFRKVD